MLLLTGTKDLAEKALYCVCRKDTDVLESVSQAQMAMIPEGSIDIHIQ